jgi:hypothetical protein
VRLVRWRVACPRSAQCLSACASQRSACPIIRAAPGDYRAASGTRLVRPRGACPRLPRVRQRSALLSPVPVPACIMPFRVGSEAKSRRPVPCVPSMSACAVPVQELAQCLSKIRARPATRLCIARPRLAPAVLDLRSNAALCLSGYRGSNNARSACPITGACPVSEGPNKARSACPITGACSPCPLAQCCPRTCAVPVQDPRTRSAQDRRPACALRGQGLRPT